MNEISNTVEFDPARKSIGVVQKIDMGTCKECKHWGKEKLSYIPNGIDARQCDFEPFDLREMKSNQCAIPCGHDGSIVFGNDYGCIHFERKKTVVDGGMV